VLAGLLMVSGIQAGTEKDQNEQNDLAIIEYTIEIIAENTEDENLDYTTLFDDLNHLYYNPLNLNVSELDQLEEAMLLSQIQINNLVEHLENNDKLLSIYELQSIKGFDLQTIRKILPFVKVNRDFDTPRLTFRQLKEEGKHELFIRYTQTLEDQKGFLPIDSADLAKSPNSRYLGSKPKLYTRYRFKYGRNISIGITAEKDAGEEFFNGSQPNGYDYYSAHLFAKNIGFVKRLAIGDYQVQLGQGLNIWSGISFGKSAQVLNIKKAGQVVKPYTSVDENRFMRGGAATIGIKNIEVTAFYSQKQIDGNVAEVTSSDTASQEVIQVTSFQQSGFHSTPGELEDKHSVGETLMGGNIAYKGKKTKLGVTAVSSAYSVDLNRNLREYNQFDFSGNGNFTIGADYNFIHRNVNVFGEVSRSQNGGIAYINGAIISLDPRLAISVLHRHFDRNYQNLFSNALSESSRNVNEDGWYVGATSRINGRWTLSAYYDIFEFPWLRFKTDAPSTGSEWLVQLNYKPSKKIEMYIRGRGESKQENTTEDVEGIDHLVSRKRTYLRYHASYKISDAVRLKSRMELAQFVLGENEPENGYVLYQDVSYKMSQVPVTFSLRFAMFETDTYNARIYAYESDVLYAYSIPAYFHSGTRTYIMARVKLLRRLDVWLRYSQTYYNNRDVISSGLTEIQGNTKSEVKAQLRFKF